MNFKVRIFGAALLTFFLGVAALACPAPVPGIIETPPCASGQTISDGPTVDAQSDAEPVSADSDIATTIEEAIIAFLLL